MKLIGGVEALPQPGRQRQAARGCLSLINGVLFAAQPHLDNGI